MSQVFERIMHHFRVLIIAAFISVITWKFGIDLIGRLVPSVTGEVLALLVGTGVGGLVAVLGQLVTPPAGATVPQESHDKLIAAILESEGSAK